jgi:hypothetical protein
MVTSGETQGEEIECVLILISVIKIKYFDGLLWRGRFRVQVGLNRIWSNLLFQGNVPLGERERMADMILSIPRIQSVLAS